MNDSWREIEAGFQDVMVGDGMSREAIEWILTDIRPRILAGTKSTTFTMTDIPSAAIEPVQRAVTEAETFIRNVVTDLIGQMFLLESELYAAKFADAHSPTVPPSGIGRRT